MENNVSIKSIYQVFNGVLKIGILKSNPMGRRSDALVYFTDGEITYKFADTEITATAESITPSIFL